LKDNGNPLYKAAAHLPIQGGKRMRPFLVIKGCQAVGGKVEDAVPAASAIELLHNFTLIHDDIMDNDLLRRGVPTVHTLWGVPMAILAGDLLFAESLHVLLSGNGDPERLRRSAEILTRSTITLSEGQYMDISFESRVDVSEEEYLDMVYRKTGALFQAGGEMGGIMGGGDARSVELLGTYGRDMGIGFQIFDDYLGMTSSENILGKSVGNDIREGKKTLIVIKAMQTPARDHLLGVLGKRDATDSEIASLLELIKENGVLDYVFSKAKDYVDKARTAIAGLPQSPARATLLELADYAISRER
jgi:geranylgeranyl diphosphate synthase type I